MYLAESFLQKESIARNSIDAIRIMEKVKKLTQKS